MILLGSPTISPQRRRAFETGAIIAMLDGDRIDRLIFGTAAGADAMFVEYRIAEDDTRFLLGRYRIHQDDKLHESEDMKQVVQLAAGPEVPPDVWRQGTTSALWLGHGFFEWHEHDCGGCSPEEFYQILPEVMGQAGWDISLMQAGDGGGEGRDGN